MAYEPVLFQPEKVLELHEMRIAAKWLRYTMENFAPLYGGELKDWLNPVREMQEQLGDIHDCDVWIDQITTLLLRERALLRSGKGTKRPDTTTLASLRLLLHDRETERWRRYRQFVRYWQALERVHLWDEFRASLDTGRKSSFRPSGTYQDDEAAELVNAFAGIYPGTRSHCRHVTMLALRLFDDLQHLHGLVRHAVGLGYL